MIKKADRNRITLSLWKTGAGFSLVELMVASLIGVIAIFAIVKASQGLWEASYGARKEAEAAALAESIVARIRGMNLFDVYSADSDRKTPNYTVTPATNPVQGVDKFRGNTRSSDPYYLLTWDVHPSSPVLFGIERDMRSRGFDRFTIRVHYMRRLSTESSYETVGLEDIVPWQDRTFDYTPLDGCDDTAPALCFRDVNGDGDYYDGQAETPNSGVRKVVVTIYGKGTSRQERLGGAQREVAVRRILLTNSGLTSAGETVTADSKLQFNVFHPGYYIHYFTAQHPTDPSIDLVSHLELKTQRGYSHYLQFHSAYFSSRCDLQPIKVTLNQHLDPVNPNGPRVFDQTGVGLTGPGGNFLFAVQTIGTGFMDFFVQKGGLNIPPPDSAVPTFSLDLGSGQASGVMGSDYRFNGTDGMAPLINALDTAGHYFVWVRKRVDSMKSSWALRILVKDTTAPVCAAWDPQTPGPGQSPGGLTPWVTVKAHDHGIYNNWAAGSGAGIYPCLSALIISPVPYDVNNPATVANATITWVGKGGDYDLKPDKRNPTWSADDGESYRLLNHENLPPPFPPGTHYFTFEFGDRVGYKSSHTWTAALPDYTTHAANPPTISIAAAAIPGVTGAATVFFNAAGTNVSASAPVDFRSISFEDLESGIDFNSVSLDHCQDAAGTLDCISILNTGVRPGSLPFGDYFRQTNDTGQFLTGETQTRLSDRAVYSFSGFAGQTRFVIVRAKNWQGVSVQDGSLKVLVGL